MTDDRHDDDLAAVVATLADLPVPPHAWRTTPADVLVHGQARRRRTRALQSGAGVSSVAAAAIVASLVLPLGSAPDVVPAAPRPVASAPPTSEPTAIGPSTSGSSAEEPAAALDLADGAHLAYLTDVDVAARRITFDVVVWLTDDEADAAADEESGGRGGSPNGFFVQNTNPKLRTATLTADAIVRLIRSGDAGDGVTPVPTPFAELPDRLAETDGRGPEEPPGPSISPFDLTLENGKITKLVERYIP